MDVDWGDNVAEDMDFSQHTDDSFDFFRSSFSSVPASTVQSMRDNNTTRLDLNNTPRFQTDLAYVARLEKKLETLYNPPRKTATKQMIEQLSNRSEMLFTHDSSTSVQTFIPESNCGSDVPEYGSLYKRLHPDKLAVDTEELKPLVANDLLEAVNSELTSSHEEAPDNSVDDKNITDIGN